MKQQYANNTVCLLLRVARPGIERNLYSDYAEALDIPLQAADNRTGQEIVDDLVAKLRRDQQKRQRERDDLERRKVYDWLMGGEVNDGSVLAQGNVDA